MSDFYKIDILIRNSKTVEKRLTAAALSVGSGPSAKSLMTIASSQQEYITVMLTYIAGLHQRLEFLEKTATQKGTANLNHKQLKKEVMANIRIPSAPLPNQMFGKG